MNEVKRMLSMQLSNYNTGLTDTTTLYNMTEQVTGDTVLPLEVEEFSSSGSLGLF